MQTGLPKHSIDALPDGTMYTLVDPYATFSDEPEIFTPQRITLVAAAASVVLFVLAAALTYFVLFRGSKVGEQEPLSGQEKRSHRTSRSLAVSMGLRPTQELSNNSSGTSESAQEPASVSPSPSQVCSICYGFLSSIHVRAACKLCSITACLFSMQHFEDT